VSNREAEIISRRKALSMFGLAALGLAISPVVLPGSDAQAQTSTTPNPQAPQTGTERRTNRTERRQERRTERTERRQERRTARTKRRTERRSARTERRNKRRGTSSSSSTTPQ
jgi:hypothetical protein